MRPRRYQRLKQVLDRRQPDLTVVMERVNKPHNFSAILRNCDAVGVLDVHAVLPDHGIEIHHHTSAGTGRWMRIRQHPDIETALGHLRDAGIRIVAAHPGEDAIPFTDADYTLPTAFLMGAELFGVSDQAMAMADAAVRIPMMGMARSLNVSVAASLLLYEALRQRMDAGMYDARRLPEDDYRRVLFEWAHPQVALRCRQAGVPYPPLDAAGEILGTPAPPSADQEPDHGS